MRFERLSAEHDRSAFDCGEAPLNEFLRQYASQNDRRHNTRTFVLLPDDSNRVIGYYTTMVKSLEAAVVPEEEKLRNYPMPVALIARLAVDKAFQGQKLGSLLLIDALKRIVRAAAEVGIRAIEVEAKTERAARFYTHFGFQPLLDDHLHLYLPLRTLLKSKLVQVEPAEG